MLTSRSSSDDSFLGCYTVQDHTFLTTLQRNVLPLPSHGQNHAQPIAHSTTSGRWVRLYGYSPRIMANKSYEKRRGPRQCTKPMQTTQLFLPFHFSIHLHQIQSDDRCRTFLRKVKLIYFPTQYNDADDYHSSNGQRDSASTCGLQMVLVMERQYVYFAAQATFLCVTEMDVMAERNNVDHCTVFNPYPANV